MAHRIRLASISFLLLIALPATAIGQALPYSSQPPPCRNPHYTLMPDGQFVFSCLAEPQGALVHALIVGGVMLQGSDAIQTAYMIGRGGAHEANPVLQPFANQPAAFGAMKLGLVAVTTWALTRIHAIPTTRARWITGAILAEEYVLETWCIVHNANVLSGLPPRP